MCLRPKLLAESCTERHQGVSYVKIFCNCYLVGDYRHDMSPSKGRSSMSKKSEWSQRKDCVDAVAVKLMLTEFHFTSWKIFKGFTSLLSDDYYSKSISRMETQVECCRRKSAPINRIESGQLMSHALRNKARDENQHLILDGVQYLRGLRLVPFGWINESLNKAQKCNQLELGLWKVQSPRETQQFGRQYLKPITKFGEGRHYLKPNGKNQAQARIFWRARKFALGAVYRKFFALVKFSTSRKFCDMGNNFSTKFWGAQWETISLLTGCNQVHAWKPWCRNGAVLVRVCRWRTP